MVYHRKEELTIFVSSKDMNIKEKVLISPLLHILIGVD